MSSMTPDVPPDALARTLIAAAPDLALDATITPETLARLASSAGTARRVSSSLDQARVTRTPLPRLSIAQGQNAGATARASTTADFEIIGTLGEGGMGRVLLAHQRSVGRDVAIKVPKDPLHGGEPLRVEALTMGRLEHPAIVPVHAVGLDDDGGLVLVMKRVEGVEWRALLTNAEHPRWQQLDLAESDRLAFHLDVLTQVANALEYAHGRGVVHRDVKPENVLVGALGEVYLADWGIASLAQDREPGGAPRIVGTPLYMAPEMVIGDAERVTAQTDVYLLGATLHEILTGEPRHSGRTLQEVLLAALLSAPPTYGDDVPTELAALATRATHVDPRERPQSALAFRRALDSWRTHRGSLALTRSSRAVLESLHAQIGRASASTDAPTALREIDRGLIEARFGFSQALREWPENDDARRGLREALALAVTHEVRRSGLEAARALLAEIDDPPPSIVAEVDALEIDVADKEGEQARLRALANDQDFGVGSSARRGMLSVLALIGLAISAYVGWARATGNAQFGTPQLLGFSGTLLLVAGIGSLALRRHIARNAAGVRMIVVVLITLAAVFLHRVLGVVTHTAVHLILAGDLLVYAAVIATGAAIRRRLAWFVPPLLCASFVAGLVPELAVNAFGVGSLLILVVAVARWRWLMEE